VGRSIRTHRWKYAVYAPEGDAVKDMGAQRYVEQYLYDLYSDPHELRNLIGMESHRPVAERMRKRLLARMAEAGEPPAVIELAAQNEPSAQRRVTAEEIEQ
jgi:hypothetical protein